MVQPGVADSLRGREEEGEEEEEEERRPRGRKKVKCSKEEVDPLVQYPSTCTCMRTLN